MGHVSRVNVTPSMTTTAVTVDECEALVVGVCLAAHFGLWVWGLQSTSLPHSLLLVCCTPLLLSFGSILLGLAISRGEVAGAALGAIGVGIMAADVGQGAPSRLD